MKINKNKKSPSVPRHCQKKESKKKEKTEKEKNIA